jgi:hypothetical protein
MIFEMILLDKKRMGKKNGNDKTKGKKGKHRNELYYNILILNGFKYKFY